MGFQMKQLVAFWVGRGRMKYLCLLLLGILTTAGTARAASKVLNPTQKCELAKLAAQGELQACLNRSARLVFKGQASIAAECQSTFTAALAAIDAAAAKAGTSCRYIDNGDQTVSDLDTGLMWEQTDDPEGAINDTCSGSADPSDVNNCYEWTSTGMAPDGTVFTQFLGTFNNGQSLDGTTITGCFANYCDWRLPSVIELQGIVNTSDNPTIDPIFGPTQPNIYWSATTAAGGNGNTAWEVDFYYGVEVYFNKGNYYPARAVRGGL
jgi:hypothetical protein